MKSPLQSSIFSARTMALALGVMGFAAQQASANLIMDLRAVSVTGSAILGGGKTVTNIAVGDTITFELFAQVISVTPQFSFSTGSILSTGGVGNEVNGNLGAATNVAPFNNAALLGANVDLNADGNLDRGTNTLATTTNAIFTRAGSNALGGPGTPIAGGAEFKLYSVVMTVTSASDIGVASTINWRSQVYASGASAAATWGENGSQYVSQNVGVAPTRLNSGTGAIQAGISNTIGSAVSLAAVVPEPSAFGMVALGALGLVGFRRLGIRRA